MKGWRSGVIAGGGWLMICWQVGWVRPLTFDFLASLGWWGGTLILLGILTAIEEFGQ